MLAATAGAAALLSAIAGPAGTASASTSTRASVSVSNIADDANWLLQGQLPDGAIAWYVDKSHISPYLANYAAIGLAEARKQTGAQVYSDAAWSWLHWYAAHQDSNGFVTDYDVDATGIETSTGDEDSTDAYAGTYLSALRATYVVDPNWSQLTSLHSSIAAAVGAIEATQDIDGLTFAKPSWPVKYLMDQTETYNGLVSAGSLASQLGDRALARRARADAAAMKTGIASLWDPPTGAYDWAKSGGLNTTDWTQLYPDAMEQAWIAGSPAISATRAHQLVNTFVQDQPLWDSPTATASVNGGSGTVGYWSVAGWALLRVGRTSQALAAADSIRTAALAADRDWPFTTGDAAELIVLESGDSSLITP
ncbi:MAG: hypothetical protein ACRDV3_02890 [Acidothermaceae bacterium]